MKYVGSKRRILKDILPIILKGRVSGQTFVDCFCGSGIVSQSVDAPAITADINPYLISLLMAVKDGWKPPGIITEEEYVQWKTLYNDLENTDIYDAPDWRTMAMIGFVGFCCSFGGKFWGGYARGNDSKGEPRNYADEQSRNLVKRAAKIRHVNFVCCDYRRLDIPNDSIIYADPPYAQTTKYKNRDGFDHNEFWDWCRQKNKEGHTLFISEYVAPDDFECVWEKEVVSGLDLNTGGKRAVEKLFYLSRKENSI